MSERYNKDSFYFQRMEDKHDSSFRSSQIEYKFPRDRFLPFWVYCEGREGGGLKKLMWKMGWDLRSVG